MSVARGRLRTPARSARGRGGGRGRGAPAAPARRASSTRPTSSATSVLQRGRARPGAGFPRARSWRSTAGALAIEAALLVLLVRAPAARLRGPFRRPIAGRGARGRRALGRARRGAAAARRVMRASARWTSAWSPSRWAGWAGDVAKSPAIGGVFAGAGAALVDRADAALPAALVGAGGRGRRARSGRRTIYAGPVVLDPLFNKFTPLPTGRLRSDVLELARRGRRRRGRGLRGRRQPPHDRRQRLRHRAGHDQARRALRHAARALQPRRAAPRGRPRARSRPPPRRPARPALPALVAPAGLLAVALLERIAPGPRRAPRRADAARAGARAGARGQLRCSRASNQLSRRVEARADASRCGSPARPSRSSRFERRIACERRATPTRRGWRDAAARHPSRPTSSGSGSAKALRAAAQR